MSAHEDLTRRSEVKGSSDRSFGFVFTTVFALIGLAPLLHHTPVRVWALAVAVFFLAAAMVRASVLHPLNVVWTRFSLVLNRIVTPIIAGLVFFLVVTPISVLFRLRGKDVLGVQRDPNSNSYWIHRQPPGPAPETMSNQF